MANPNSAEIDPRSGFCSKNSIFYSKRKPIQLRTDPNIDVVTFISSHTHSSTTAFIDASTGQRLSYQDLWRSVKFLSFSLSSIHGVRKGQVVLILSPNSLHFPIVSLAVLSIGAILTTTNPLNNALELAAQIEDSRPVLAFTTSALLPKLGGHQFPLLLLEEEPVSQDDVATLLYSSGTTGTSKGVVATHRNMIAMVQILHDRYRSDEDLNTFLCTVPMFHVYGLAGFAIGMLTMGSTVVILSQFDIGEMLRAIVEYQVTHLPVVPPVLVALQGSEKVLLLGKLHKVICGGAPLGREVVEGFREKYPDVHIMQGYGLTESTAMGASADTEEDSRRYGSAGLLVPNTEARIVDPMDGKFLSMNSPGELWIRGPFVMKEYFKNEEATRLTLDLEGWLRTGDLCYIDEDGYLFVVDRLKELIKYKAYQVAPAELEALLLKHPQIVDAAVIPFPDKEVGQYPMAYVVRRAESELSESSVIEFIRRQVAPYKKIRRVAFVPAVPKNQAGKILRKDLIKLATSISML
ncbi:4-coumarate--CoA ligase-like 5 [Platanthera guangdongensis]|uniref:4-coumarate--CoA ligase n=1 Tax=Platanthera guangdongensis TaxID=2320717 RepID=A0ABR2LJ63_9ASPA